MSTEAASTFTTAMKAIFDEQNRMTVRLLSDKYGFDAVEALKSLSIEAEVKKVKKVKKEKDPSKPKRAATGYILFGQDVRPKIKESKPEIKPKDTVREIAEQWKALSQEKRDEWNTKAKEMASSGSDEEIVIESNSDSE